MSDSYYVRSQGKVNGPFSFEELKTKAGKGHLRKTHQVSTDQENWTPARKVEGLFPTPPQPFPRKPKNPVDESELVEVALIEDEPPDIVEPEIETEWYYCLQGDEQTQGPISESQLQKLFLNGQLPGDTLVWNESLNDWVEGSRVPALNMPTRPGSHLTNDVVLLDEDSHPYYPHDALPVPPMASASLILGILGIAIPVGIGSVLAIVFGHLALNQIRAHRRMYQGEGMAKVGLMLGYASLAILLPAFVVWVIIKILQS